jgi:hypothetical protein
MSTSESNTLENEVNKGLEVRKQTLTRVITTLRGRWNLQPRWASANFCKALSLFLFCL